MLKGSCNCGGVQFEISGAPKGASVCHCGQCRKQSGHTWSSAYVPEGDLNLTSDTTLNWFSASPTARRGFCSTCGAFLFWKAHDEETISFALGSIDGPTGIQLEKHIFTADKGDYYTIADGLPQKET
ncbi:MAG: GFA family protein [Brevirhabdus sp.]